MLGAAMVDAHSYTSATQCEETGGSGLKSAAPNAGHSQPRPEFSERFRSSGCQLRRRLATLGVRWRTGYLEPNSCGSVQLPSQLRGLTRAWPRMAAAVERCLTHGESEVTVTDLFVVRLLGIADRISKNRRLVIRAAL